ncbi:T9SS type A sorting domain-containing protein [uncultured Cyclobacterium sp.]|uniref:T9SS type A sorting domain-containing protein n=1 Tax=uncultured Cyclobacterium sp. TaxID=453820 RepID=UPI0030ED3636|tara:strand:+ start:3228 stop:5351 length:2124 start_codon:yes stop_codon:yes gene_type:complete
MLTKKIHLLILFAFFANIAKAQYNFAFETNLEVYDENGEALPMPFVGGINAAQFQQFDSNNNGKEELVIWDINSGNIKVFEKNGTAYSFLPGGSYLFPEDVNAFLLLVDFDGDSKKDLFTGSPFGIKAYKNITPVGSAIPVWEVAQSFLRLENGSNLTANILDIPLIEDIDQDGDLDVLVFNFASGDFLEYYQNTSMERNGTPGIDQFKASQNHWGNFEFCGCGDISFGFTCGGNALSNARMNTDRLKILHSGGHSLLYKDLNQDGIKDLLMGRDECNSLYFLANEGSDIAPVFSSISTNIPQFGQLPQFPVFHAAYLLEEELIVSSHSSATSFTYKIDFAKALYRLPSNSESSPDLFLKDDMLDFGENSRPFFTGNKSNGELFIAANTKVGDKIIGKIFAYELTESQARLTSNDYLNISQLALTEPSFQRFQTKDNQSYHIVTGDAYESNVPQKKIYISEVANPEDISELMLPSITLRGLDQVHFFHDQINNYLLLARQTGELMLYSLNNRFEAALLSNDFLDFIDNPVARNLAVTVKSGAKPLLMAINQQGVLYVAEDFLQEEEKFPVSIKLAETIFPETRLGRNAFPTFVPHLLGDGFDLILGSKAGGLEYLSQLGDGGTEPGASTEILLFPNPTNGREFKIAINKNALMNIYSPSGALITQGIELVENQENLINSYGFPSGLYLLEIINDENERHYRKLIVSP